MRRGTAIARSGWVDAVGWLYVHLALGQCLGYDFRVKALDEDGLIGWASELHGYYATPKGTRYAERQVQS